MRQKKYSKMQRQIAKEILTELEQQWKEAKATDAGQLFYRLHHFIQSTYLSEDGGK